MEKNESENMAVGARMAVVVVEMAYNLSLVLRKPVFGVSDQVWHKPGCTANESG